MGLLWNIYSIISIFLIFLQNARVHISGRVYRGDFGGLQLSHHLFLLHQNDKLPKFRQQYRGGMQLCFHALPTAVIACYVFDSQVVQRDEWNEGDLRCPSSGAGFRISLLFSFTVQNCLVQWNIFFSMNTASNITTADTDALCLVESIGLSAAYFQHHKPCDFKGNPNLK